MTVIIDLTPVRNRTGPARLLNMVPGRSKQVFSRWLAARTSAFRAGIQIVAMDGFTGFKTASKEHLPDAIEVMDPFHVVQLAGDALDRTRQRVQQETLGHRGRTGDPLYAIRRELRTGEAFLTEKQQQRLDRVFADPRHADVLRAWRAYQQVVAAYREKLTGLGRKRLREAINGRLEPLRGSALGFRNLASYIARSLLEAGGFRPLPALSNEMSPKISPCSAKNFELIILETL